MTPEVCRSLYDSIPNLVARCQKDHGYRVRTSQKSAKAKDGTPKDFPPDLRDMISWVPLSKLLELRAAGNVV